MKSIIKKVSILAFLVVQACGTNTNTQPSFSIEGEWENSMKNQNGVVINTTMKITRKDKFFDAVLEINSDKKIDDISLKKVNISGTINQYGGRRHTITDIESGDKTYSETSFLEISENGSFLTLQPGQVKFRRK